MKADLPAPRPDLFALSRPALFTLSRSALLSLFRHANARLRFPVLTVRRVFNQAVALGMVLLLLPLTQIDALAQQQWPQNPQYAPNQYPSQYQNQYQNQYSGQYAGNQYAQPGPYASQPPGYQQQPYNSPMYQEEATGQYQPMGQQMGQSTDGAQPYGAQPQQAFAPEQLDQLVAPIALYPDALVAQILAASTYPAQVAAADHWLQSMGYAAPDDVAAAADAQQTWDPSVKALTAFPQVLAMLDRDLQWTTDLGNAYYNQPQDVLQTIQVLRQRAEDAGTLRNSPQEQLTYDQGYIQLAPANPQVVYVPQYNPWDAYGAPINPYPGFSLIGAIGSVIGAGLRYGAPIALGAFMHTPFGWMGWALNWLASAVFFNHAPYASHSTSVAHWGNPGGGFGGRGGFPTRPRPMSGQSAGNSQGQGNYYRGQGNYGRPTSGYNGQNYARGYAAQPSRPQQNYAYSRPAEPAARNYAGGYAGGYGSNYGRSAEPYAYSRPQAAMPVRPQTYASPQQFGRTPGYAYSAPRGYNDGGYGARGYVEQRSYTNERSYAAPAPASRGFREPEQREQRSGGMHLFGGGHAETYHSPKAPKMSGGRGGGGGGLFHHSGGGGGGKHH